MPRSHSSTTIDYSDSYRRGRASIALIVAVHCVASGAAAADWPQWQGPDRNAISAEKGLLQEWPAGGPPLAWRIDELGGGDSAPAIAVGRIFGMNNRGDEEIVWALDEADGREVWVRPLGPAVKQQMPQSKEGPGCTPTVDGDRLYVLGMGGTLACLRVADGGIVWQHKLTEDFGGVLPMWSYRESPLIDGEKVICTPGGPEATMAALDKLTGETIWTCKVPDLAGNAAADGGAAPPRRGRFAGRGPGSSAAYSSAIAIDVDGQRQYVQFLAKTVVGVAASDGAFLWRYDPPANPGGINCSTPIFQDGLLFASSAYGAGGGAVKLTKNAQGNFVPDEVYFSKRMQNHHGGMVVIDGCLYGANGGNEGGALVCLDFESGKILWNERSKRRAPKGSIAFADGRLYYRTEEGPVLLIEPSGDEYLERGRFDQPDRSNSPAWSHPVVAIGKLYIRDQGELFCYDVTAK